MNANIYWAASKGRCSKTDRLSSSGIQTVLILGGLIMNTQYIRVGDYYIPDLEFGELYRLLNGMPLREMDWIIDPVCALCRNHERAGFILKPD